MVMPCGGGIGEERSQGTSRRGGGSHGVRVAAEESRSLSEPAAIVGDEMSQGVGHGGGGSYGSHAAAEESRSEQGPVAMRWSWG
jgi:hypothetical protein